MLTAALLPKGTHALCVLDNHRFQEIAARSDIGHASLSIGHLDLMPSDNYTMSYVVKQLNTSTDYESEAGTTWPNENRMLWRINTGSSSNSNCGEDEIKQIKVSLGLRRGI